MLNTAQNTPVPPPDEHMQEMAWFVGQWQIASRMKTAEDEWKEEPLTAVHTWEMGGHLIFEHFFGPLLGEPFEAWSLRSYSKARNRWEQRWLDTSGSGFLQWMGSYADGKYIGYAARFVDDDFRLTGQKGTREVFEDIRPDGFAWRLENTEDAGETWVTTWMLNYQRIET